MYLLKSFYKIITNTKVNATYNILGYAGVFPLLLLLILIWILDKRYHPFIINSIFSYITVILTFIGAVYWGFAFFLNNKQKAKLCYLFSVLPGILASLTFIFVSNFFLKTILFIIYFLSIYQIEKKFSKSIKIPINYLRLRFKLTFLLTLLLICLIFTLLFYFFN